MGMWGGGRWGGGGGGGGGHGQCAISMGTALSPDWLETCETLSLHVIGVRQGRREHRMLMLQDLAQCVYCIYPGAPLSMCHVLSPLLPIINPHSSQFPIFFPAIHSFLISPKKKFPESLKEIVGTRDVKTCDISLTNPT